MDKSISDLVKRFKHKSKSENQASREAAIRRDVWDEAASWAESLADEIEKPESEAR